LDSCAFVRQDIPNVKKCPDSHWNPGIFCCALPAHDSIQCKEASGSPWETRTLDSLVLERNNLLYKFQKTMAKLAIVF